MIDISTLTEDQRQRFISEAFSKRQNIVTVMLLTFFLGGIGAHKFYFGENKKGMLYLLLCWTFIPSIIAFFELPSVKKRVEEYNDRLAFEVFTRIKEMG
jgi:TM2 domain-containing membrane protein YozV